MKALLIYLCLMGCDGPSAPVIVTRDAGSLSLTEVCEGLAKASYDQGRLECERDQLKEKKAQLEGEVRALQRMNEARLEGRAQ
jgi:hypothetical protein